jgi:hypothetical protein
MIMRLVRAEFEGVNTFSDGNPVGDGIGPLITGIFMNDLSEEELEYREDFVFANMNIDNRDIIIIRAKGPGARLGKIGKAVNNIIKEKEIQKLITVDAALKLEGEKTGTVAEGIGVVIGGFGVDNGLLKRK